MAKHVWKHTRGKLYCCLGCKRVVGVRFPSVETPESVAKASGYPVLCPYPAPTPKDLRKLWDTAREWVMKNEVTCAEALGQVDSVQEALPELAEKVCKLVGYFKEENTP